MNEIPIIIYHEGNQTYLQECIDQAKKYNNTVILIGDESNKDMNADYWYDAAELEIEEWREFADLFYNMSKNSAKFELQCFKRFFMIYALMQKNIIKQCIHIDSDVLCYYDFSKFNAFAGIYAASLSIPKKQDAYRWSVSAMTSYWTKKGIASFCSFVIAAYKDKNALLTEKWNYHKKNNLPGGICDMTLLYLWSKQEKEIRILNTMEQFKAGDDLAVIDNNISTVENGYLYDKLFHLKKVTFHDGIPYLHKEDGTKIRTLALHFQGGAKRFMKFYASGRRWNPYYYLLAVLIQCKRIIFSPGVCTTGEQV